MIVSREISLDTKGNGNTINITPQIARLLDGLGISNGTVTVFVTHTTCGVTIMEYEPGLVSDFRDMWERNAPATIPYQHNQRWGDENGHSHVRASLLGASLVVPFVDRKMTLGTWQQIVLVDFDNQPRRRKIILQFTGE